ncbi:MAG: hypothetical protein J5950_04430 [Clostridia bacterium]|nr:hypothetical protein [Clostridia bacterium]
MKLEYNIVGVAKNSEEDLRAIYDSMGLGVFALALSVTGSRKLARETAVETFKRVVRYAVTFDTDMNGQYWILDICMQLSRNSMRDPAVSASQMAREKVDNASALLQDALFGLGGDRGTMLLLKATTDLKNVDIAQLCGYYSGSAGAEIRRGIARLADIDESREKKEILRTLKKDVAAICPDYYDRIKDEERTALSHVSHEAMYLSDGEAAFSADGGEEEKVAQREDERRKKARSVRIRVIAVLLGLLLIGGIVAGIIISSRSGSEPSKETVPPGVQYGNTINMVFAGGKLFYRGVGGGIYCYDPDSGEQTLVYDGTARELVTDGTRLYFRSDRSKLFSVNTDGTGLNQLCSISGTTLCFSGGRLYFSASDGIYSVSPEGEGDGSGLVQEYIEEVEDAPARYCIVVTDNGKVMFSGGADKGIYSVSGSSGSSDLKEYNIDEVYYMTLWNGKLLFDAVTADGIELFTLDIDAKQLTSAGVRSYSAAYCTDGNKLYYEGYIDDGSGVKKDIGIYVTESDSGEQKLLLPVAEDALHVSEMITDGTRLYCFCSDGKQEGERRLISYALNDFSDSKVIFDVKR